MSLGVGAMLVPAEALTPAGVIDANDYYTHDTGNSNNPVTLPFLNAFCRANGSDEAATENGSPDVETFLPIKARLKKVIVTVEGNLVTAPFTLRLRKGATRTTMADLSGDLVTIPALTNGTFTFEGDIEMEKDFYYDFRWVGGSNNTFIRSIMTEYKFE